MPDLRSKEAQQAEARARVSIGRELDSAFARMRNNVDTLALESALVRGDMNSALRVAGAAKIEEELGG